MDRRATVCGREVNYRLTGPPDGPVLVFVHGLAATGASWGPVAEMLSDAFRVLTYDLRSHGLSDPVREACTRSDLAHDLRELLRVLELKNPIVIGHSAGGVVAMQFAVDYPSEARAFVFVGTASECNDKTRDWYRKSAEKARRKGGDAALKTFGLRGDENPMAPDGEGFAHTAIAMSTLNEDPLTETLRTMAQPTLIVIGEDDFLGVGGSVILSRAIEGSQLEIVRGHGHAIFLEDPDGFCDRIRDFADSVSISRPSKV